MRATLAPVEESGAGRRGSGEGECEGMGQARGYLEGQDTILIDS